jgi:hypothetical protein
MKLCKKGGLKWLCKKNVRENRKGQSVMDNLGPLATLGNIRHRTDENREREKNNKKHTTTRKTKKQLATQT